MKLMKKNNDKLEIDDKFDSVEDSEIKLMYTTAYAIYFICQDAERRMLKNLRAFKQKTKQHFTELMKALNRTKYEQDQLFQDYVQAWENKLSNYDTEQSNANALARLMLLWHDRVEGYDGRVKEVEDFIKNKWPCDDIADIVLHTFEMTKLKQ